MATGTNGIACYGDLHLKDKYYMLTDNIDRKKCPTKQRLLSLSFDVTDPAGDAYANNQLVRYEHITPRMISLIIDNPCVTGESVMVALGGYVSGKPTRVIAERIYGEKNMKINKSSYEWKDIYNFIEEYGGPGTVDLHFITDSGRDYMVLDSGYSECNLASNIDDCRHGDSSILHLTEMRVTNSSDYYVYISYKNNGRDIFPSRSYYGHAYSLEPGESIGFPHSAIEISGYSDNSYDYSPGGYIITKGGTKYKSGINEDYTILYNGTDNSYSSTIPGRSGNSMYNTITVRKNTRKHRFDIKFESYSGFEKVVMLHVKINDYEVFGQTGEENITTKNVEYILMPSEERTQLKVQVSYSISTVRPNQVFQGDVVTNIGSEYSGQNISNDACAVDITKYVDVSSFDRGGVHIVYQSR